MALSRPPSLAQLISVGMPDNLRDLLESGPPPGIISRVDDVGKEQKRRNEHKSSGPDTGVGVERRKLDSTTE